MGKIILIALLVFLSLSSTVLFLSSKASVKPETKKTQEISHVVKKGETLTEIAEIYYKNFEFWTNLWNDNQGIINPSIIEPGTIVLVQPEMPKSVEDVDSKLMVRLLNNPYDNLDPQLAFIEADIRKTDIKPVNKAVVITMPQATVTPEGTFVSHTTQPSVFDEVYKQAGDKYGIPWQVLYGLHLTETGQRDGKIFNGQGSGAQGPMQFMPGTWKAYGVDGNGDGSADIDNAVDAIHAAANYLAKHGGVKSGLYYYGGNTSGTLQAACEKGYCL